LTAQKRTSRIDNPQGILVVLTSLLTIIAFFVILAAVYPLAVFIVSAAGWWEKKAAGKRNRCHYNEGAYREAVERIDQRTDRFKEVFFFVAVCVIFFAVAPFAVFSLLLF